MRLRLYERRRRHGGMHSVYAVTHTTWSWVCARQRPMDANVHKCLRRSCDVCRYSVALSLRWSDRARSKAGRAALRSAGNTTQSRAAGVESCSSVLKVVYGQSSRQIFDLDSGNNERGLSVEWSIVCCSAAARVGACVCYVQCRIAQMRL